MSLISFGEKEMFPNDSFCLFLAEFLHQIVKVLNFN